MTPREIFYELLKPDGQPERQLKQYEALHLVLTHPVNKYLSATRIKGQASKDRWGTTILYPEDAPGATPHITPENKVCPDVTHWRDYVHAPDLIANCSEGWEESARKARETAGDQKVICGFMGRGIFEQTHFLMGFEDTLTGFYEHPDEMHELIEYITEYRMQYVKMVIEGLHPDAIFHHDDWGTKDALFMKPEMWREFYKEPYRRFFGYIRDQGCVVIHHADSYLVPIIEDMVELGVQCWQGVLPENDIPALQKQLQGRMILMGGIGAAIDTPDSTEEEIRAYVRDALNRYCPGGHFIPCITYGAPKSVFPHVGPVIDDEIGRYNDELHMPAFPLPELPRRRAAVQETVQTVQPEDDGNDEIYTAMSEALYRGQKKKVTALCAKAVETGAEPETIISRGLIPGMDRLGLEFSAGRAFVPEMLMGGRCMSAAMEILKPLMVGKATRSVGRVALGTVRGDLHDIGKNLVKIMMQGAGIEVVDLGVDVAPEDFVQTAIDRDCGLIACSSLLTTAMNEMRTVVKLADQAGIRGRVKILIGGAPITEDFCREIGADAYTPDAAAAARMAVRLLSE